MKQTSEEPKLAHLWQKPADVLSLLSIPVSNTGEELENVKYWTAGQAIGRGEWRMRTRASMHAMIVPPALCVVPRVWLMHCGRNSEMEPWEVHFKDMSMSAKRLCEINWKLVHLTMGCKFVSSAARAAFESNTM